MKPVQTATTEGPNCIRSRDRAKPLSFPVTNAANAQSVRELPGQLLGTSIKDVMFGRAFVLWMDWLYMHDIDLNDC